MEDNLILEGLLSMVTELKEKQEAQPTPAGREETLGRLDAIGQALAELRRSPAIPEKDLRDVQEQLAGLRKAVNEQRQSSAEVKKYAAATFDGASPADALAGGATIAITALIDPFVGLLAGIVIRFLSVVSGLAV